MILCVVLAVSTIFAGTTALDRWRQFSQTHASRELIEWLRLNAGLILEGKAPETKPGPELPELSGRAGMFITLVVKGRVRGCYGAFHHEPVSTEEIFLQYMKGALFHDPRYRPIEPAELDGTAIIVTVTSYPEPVDSPNNIDIARYGVFIECSDSAGRVIVPAEFKTVSGLTVPAADKDCRYSRFEAVTIR